MMTRGSEIEGDKSEKTTNVNENKGIASIKEDLKETPFGKRTTLKSSPSNDCLRWNLVFNLLIWAVIPLPLWLPLVTPLVASYLLPSLQLFFALCWLVVNISSWRTYWRLRRWKRKNDEQLQVSEEEQVI